MCKIFEVFHFEGMLYSKLFHSIFKQGSTTYYYASIFFPRHIREDVFTLYAFVRTADDYVDALPQQKEDFLAFERQTQAAFRGIAVGNPIITQFVELAQRKRFEKAWIDAFLFSMKQDLTKHTYRTFHELEEYMYGSAEIIGLMMARIFDLCPQSHLFAKLQGKAMQLINFVRDVQEDLDLNRVYLPQEELENTKILHVPPQSNEERAQFNTYIRTQIHRYKQIQKKAEEGYQYIPKPFLIPVKTAAQMYNWTADQIQKNPLIVFEKKVKPHKLQVLYQYALNAVGTVR